MQLERLCDEVCLVTIPVLSLSGGSLLRNLRWTPRTCEPGTAYRQPFSSEQSSSGHQNPMHDCGSVYRKVPSWCGHTYPPETGKKRFVSRYQLLITAQGQDGLPIFACLNIYMDCTAKGLSRPSSRQMEPIRPSYDTLWNTASKSCKPWPILLLRTTEEVYE